MRVLHLSNLVFLVAKRNEHLNYPSFFGALMEVMLMRLDLDKFVLKR